MRGLKLGDLLKQMEEEKEHKFQQQRKVVDFKTEPPITLSDTDHKL